MPQFHEVLYVSRVSAEVLKMHEKTLPRQGHCLKQCLSYAIFSMLVLILETTADSLAIGRFNASNLR